ncbi:ATP-binding protein [Schlesneria sp. DSM 10557]|uniref:ATP-binding protein n=1 Tax=Schlesneria sp. DSM 10557 TaxID=3044399 RepID=UPI00359FEE6E
MQNSDQFEVVIQSDYESGQSIVERIMEVVSQTGFSTRDQFGIRLAVDEAVTNAIKHGNQLSPEKKVRIDFRKSDAGVRIEIEDEGDGFRPEDVPDCTADENLERPTGRGLMLMREFMTRIEYSEKGNKVVLEKLHGS